MYKRQVRQGEHIGQQSLGFQGQSLILQVVVAHNGVVEVFMLDVAIIGCGVVGAAAAYELSHLSLIHI